DSDEPSGSESSVQNTPSLNSQARKSRLRENFQKFRHIFRISPIEDGNAQERMDQLAILGARSASVASGRVGLWSDPASRQPPQLTRRPQIPNHARVPWRNPHPQQPIATPVTDLERMEMAARGARDSSHLAWRYRPENILAAETLAQREWARLYNPTTELT